MLQAGLEDQADSGGADYLHPSYRRHDKVYPEAYLFAMQELTGGVDSEFSIRVLNQCMLGISKGHWMELR
jgi:hypothetical protein